MTGMLRHLPVEPSLQGLVLQVRGCGELRRAFWLAFLGTVLYIRCQIPHLTPLRHIIRFRYNIGTPYISASH